MRIIGLATVSGGHGAATQIGDTPPLRPTWPDSGSVGFISPKRCVMHGHPGLEFARKLSVFSAFVSLGSMLDVTVGVILIYHLGDDPNTKSIVIYMESVGNARAFLSAAREVALTKPIIVIKAGRTPAAAKAAASHTGSLTRQR